MKKNLINNNEKHLKRWLKRKVSVTKAITIAFMITGIIGMPAFGLVEGTGSGISIGNNSKSGGVGISIGDNAGSDGNPGHNGIQIGQNSRVGNKNQNANQSYWWRECW